MQLPIDDIIEWDVKNWAVLIKLWTPLVESLPHGSKVLAIGERNGGLSLWLALKGFDVHCTDRIYPTETAIANHHKYGVSGKITYGQYDVVKGDDSFNSKFDLVIAKSVIGGLKTEYSNPLTRNFEVQRAAVGNIYDCLKSGGYFLSAENMDGGILGRFVKKLLGKNSGWLYLRWKDIPNLYSAFHITDAKAFGVIPALSKNKIVQNTIYYSNRYLFNFLQSSCKYIAFVTAHKP